MGQASVYEQYSAEANVGPGEAQAGPQTPPSTHGWVCGLQDHPPPEVRSVHSLLLGGCFLLVEGHFLVGGSL